MNSLVQKTGGRSRVHASITEGEAAATAASTASSTGDSDSSKKVKSTNTRSAPACCKATSSWAKMVRGKGQRTPKSLIAFIVFSSTTTIAELGGGVGARSGWRLDESKKAQSSARLTGEK